MTPFVIIPITNVNARSGAGSGFDISNKIPQGYQLTAKNTKKDGAGVIWYETDFGWVNSKFVKQPNQVKQAKAATPMVMAAVNSEDNYSADKVPANPGVNTRSLISSVTDVVDTLSAAGVNLGVLGSLAGVSTTTSQSAILSRRIFGTPFQFLDSTDMRPDDGPLGLQFTNNIMAETPIFSVIPGLPKYLKDLTTEEKQQMSQTLINKIDANTEGLREMLGEILDAKDRDLKFFEFDSDTSQYITYVDLMCRMCAIFLGIGDLLVPGTSEKYSEFNWFKWKLSNAYASQTSEAGGLMDLASDVIDSVFGSSDSKESNSAYPKLAHSMNQIDVLDNNEWSMDNYYIDFFIKPPSYSESFSNQTAESMLANAMDSGSNLLKEFAFLTSGAGATIFNTAQVNTAAWAQYQTDKINQLIKDDGLKRFFNRILTSASTIITGGNLVFPNIWQNSSYNRDFNIEITLATPYGDKESIFLEIFVPLMFLLALVLPRQATVNSYVTPFLVRANVPGFFNCEMGIIRDMQITRGGSDNSAWSVEGLPTEVTVSLSIEDLYNSLSMSNFATKNNIYNFLYNTALFDYIGNQCGISMRTTDWDKRLKLVQTLISNWPSDKLYYGEVAAKEWTAQSMFKIMAAK